MRERPWNAVDESVWDEPWSKCARRILVHLLTLCPNQLGIFDPRPIGRVEDHWSDIYDAETVAQALAFLVEKGKIVLFRDCLWIVKKFKRTHTATVKNREACEAILSWLDRYPEIKERFLETPIGQCKAVSKRLGLDPLATLCYKDVLTPWEASGKGAKRPRKATEDGDNNKGTNTRQTGLNTGGIDPLDAQANTNTNISLTSSNEEVRVSPASTPRRARGAGKSSEPKAEKDKPVIPFPGQTELEMLNRPDLVSSYAAATQLYDIALRALTVPAPGQTEPAQAFTGKPRTLAQIEQSMFESGVGAVLIARAICWIYHGATESPLFWRAGFVTPAQVCANGGLFWQKTNNAWRKDTGRIGEPVEAIAPPSQQPSGFHSLGDLSDFVPPPGGINVNGN